MENQNQIKKEIKKVKKKIKKRKEWIFLVEIRGGENVDFFVNKYTKEITELKGLIKGLKKFLK